MASYTDAAAIASWLGTTLTPEQEAEAELAASAITAWIDHTTGRTWQAASPITDEVSRVVGKNVYLGAAPVLAVTSVGLRSGVPNDPPVALAPDDYELIDPAHGVVLVGPGAIAPYELAVVSYTHDATDAPADIAFAAKVLAADLLYPTLHPESHGVSQLDLIQSHISVKYANAGTASASPAVSLATRTVLAYRRPVVA